MRYLRRGLKYAIHYTTRETIDDLSSGDTSAALDFMVNLERNDDPPINWRIFPE